MCVFLTAPVVVRVRVTGWHSSGLCSFSSSFTVQHIKLATTMPSVLVLSFSLRNNRLTFLIFFLQASRDEQEAEECECLFFRLYHIGSGQKLKSGLFFLFFSSSLQ